MAKGLHVPPYGLYALSERLTAERLRGGLGVDRVFTGIDEFYLRGVILGVCEVSGDLILHVLVRSVLNAGTVLAGFNQDRGL